MIAFVAATLPLHMAGMPMAFWVLLAGVGAAGLLESGQLMRCWATKPGCNGDRLINTRLRLPVS